METRQPSSGKTNLPPNYETVPQILAKIEESKRSVASAESPEVRRDPEKSSPGSDTETLSIPAKSLESMTPTERAAAKAKETAKPASDAGDGPTRLLKTPKPAPVVTDSSSRPEKREIVSPPPSEEVTLSQEDAASGSVFRETHTGNEADVKIDTANGGKGKLARLLGKGDFRADDLNGPDVVDGSEYMKPDVRKSSQHRKETETGKPAMRQREPSIATQSTTAKPAVAAKRDSGPKTEVKNDALVQASEADALRAELESQVKWESVRLQEAVRSQLLEDKKLAAKEAAAVAEKHSEELVKVREEALTQADGVLAERMQEMKERTAKERDDELARLLRSKEEELRENLELEFAKKHEEQTSAREAALMESRALVKTLTEQFDTVLQQTERAKVAAKRASSAFLLREDIELHKPLRKHLLDASDRSELGSLVALSVPESAMLGGVKTIDGLKADFRSASKHGLSVAMVPEGQSGTLWGHFLGAIFSRLKIPVDNRIDSDEVPKCNEDRIRRAQLQVFEGDLGGAVTTLESLNGLSAEVMADWVGSARARIAADLASDVLLADAIIAELKLTKSIDGVTTTA